MPGVARLVCLGCEEQCVVGGRAFRSHVFVSAEQDLSNLPQSLTESRIHPDDLAWVQDRVNHSLQTGEPYNAEYRVRRADGSYLWVLASGACEFDEHGAPFRFPGC